MSLVLCFVKMSSEKRQSHLLTINTSLSFTHLQRFRQDIKTISHNVNQKSTQELLENN